MTERRQVKRFAVPDNAFAVLHSNSIIVTSLIDINMDGLAFEYIIDSDDHIGNARELDIFCADDDIYDFHLQNVPFEITSQEAVSVLDVREQEASRPALLLYTGKGRADEV